MTVDEAREIVRRLDPEYAERIEAGRLVDEVESYVWIGAAERLQEETP